MIVDINVLTTIDTLGAVLSLIISISMRGRPCERSSLWQCNLSNAIASQMEIERNMLPGAQTSVKNGLSNQ
jgi:hypothetical protein